MASSPSNSLQRSTERDGDSIAAPFFFQDEYNTGISLIHMSAKPILFFALALTCPLTASAQAAQSKGDAIQQYLRNAEQDLAQKRPDLAIPQLEAALALDPGNIDAQANLGVLLYFKGDAVNAAPHLRAAVKAKPELWKIQVLLGLTEFRTKDADNARVDLEAALPHLKGEKVQREAGNALIASYSASGEMEKAARVVSVLLETQPTDAHLLLLSYRLNTDIANNSLVTLALAAPDSAEMHQAIARELTRRGCALSRSHPARSHIAGALFRLWQLAFQFDGSEIAVRSRTAVQGGACRQCVR